MALIKLQKIERNDNIRRGLNDFILPHITAAGMRYIDWA